MNDLKRDELRIKFANESLRWDANNRGGYELFVDGAFFGFDARNDEIAAIKAEVDRLNGILANHKLYEEYDSEITWLKAHADLLASAATVLGKCVAMSDREHTISALQKMSEVIEQYLQFKPLKPKEATFDLRRDEKL